MRGKKLREGVGLTVLNLFFIALCFVTLIPILYALSVSFNGQNALLSSDFSFIPKDFTLDNYLRVFTGEDIMTWFGNSVILAAAKIAGVDRVFRVGGAQAVAALAYGTETIPRVDKIVGPGNAFVAEAKRQVFGQVAIDMIAGPSEILIVADKSADPVWLAADMLSQAEHDKLATAILITDSAALAEKTAAELEAQLEVLPRKDIAGASVEANGKIIVTDDLSEAVNIANEIAPEHLELCVERPFDWLGRVRNAGSVFLGHYCPEPLGDYLSGTNHTLPTMGTARFSSPLGVDDFIKRSYFSYYTAEGLESVADDVALFADTEGLHAHAVSATIRRRGRSE